MNFFSASQLLNTKRSRKSYRASSFISLMLVIFFQMLMLSAGAEVLMDSNTAAWHTGSAKFTFRNDNARPGAKLFTVTKTDKTAEWGSFMTKDWIKVEPYQGKRLHISFSMKVDSLECLNERKANYICPLLTFYPENTSTAWSANCGSETLDRIKTATDWIDYQYDCLVPSKARYAIFQISFGQVNGVIEIANIRIENQSGAVEVAHSDEFTTAALVPRRNPNSNDAAALCVKDANGQKIINRITFDDRGLYFDVSVPDKSFFQPYKNDEIWKGDSVQMAFDTMGDRSESPNKSDDYEMVFALVDGKPFVCPSFVPPDHPFRLLDIQTEITAGPEATRYKVELPWRALAPFLYEQSNWLGYSFLVNQNDGKGRSFREWSSGIGPSKNPSQYGMLLLDKESRGVSAVLTIDKTDCFEGESIAATVHVPAAVPKTIVLTVSVNGTVLNDKQYVLKSGETSFTIRLNSKDLKPGGNTLCVQARLLPEQITILNRELKINALSTQDIIQEVAKLRQEINDSLTILRQLLSPFDSKDRKPRGQIASLAIVELFKDYIVEDIELKHPAWALREAKETLQIARAAIKDMTSGNFILSSEKSVLDLQIANGRFVNPRGETVYPFGYCYSWVTCPDFKVRKQLGITVEAMSWPPRPQPSQEPPGYTVSAKVEDSYHQPQQKRANNIALDLSSFSESFMDKEPFSKLYKDDKTPGNHFLNFDPDSPAVKEFISKAGAACGECLASLPREVRGTIIGCDLANEPAFTSITKNTMSNFRDYLSKKYKDVKALNDAWHTDFAGFDAIGDIRPLLPDAGHKVAYYDWCVFGQQRFYAHFNNEKNALVSKAGQNPPPNVFVKFMNHETWSPHVSFDRGYDRELLQTLTAINGGDGGLQALQRGSPYAMNWFSIAAPVEYLRSLAPQQPIFDDEWHLPPIASVSGEQVRAAVWLGAWQGQSATTLYALYRDKQHRTIYGMFHYGTEAWWKWIMDWGVDWSPSIMNAYSQEAIRIGDSMERVRQFPESEHPVRIYHSLSSSIFDGKKHIEAVEAIFEAFYFQDVNIGFVTERMLKGERPLPPDMKLLIIPNARYADPATLRAIEKLEEKGVHILLVGGENLSRDTYDRPISEKIKLPHPDLWKLTTAANYRSNAEKALQTAGISPMFTLKNVNGQHPELVSARFAAYEGKKIGYAVNLGTKPQEFKIVDSAGKTMEIEDCFIPEGKTAEKLTTIRLEPCGFINFNVKQ